MSGTIARRQPRPDIPTGEQLEAELRAAADEQRIPLYELVGHLCGTSQKPTNFLSQLRISKWPRQSTIDRIRAVIDGKEPPPAPQRVQRPRKHPQMVVGAARLEAMRAEAEETVARRAAASRLTTRHPSSPREPTAAERAATPSALIRWAQDEWPDIAREVEAYAAETGRTLGEAWQSVISAGLQCLREAD